MVFWTKILNKKIKTKQQGDAFKYHFTIFNDYCININKKNNKKM